MTAGEFTEGTSVAPPSLLGAVSIPAEMSSLEAFPLSPSAMYRETHNSPFGG